MTSTFERSRFMWGDTVIQAGGKSTSGIFGGLGF